MALLSVDGVSKAFGERILLDNINFRINEGDKIAFIGNNGVGKSTFFKIIRGEYEPDSGKVMTHGSIVGFLSQNMEEQDFNGHTLIPRRIVELEHEMKDLEARIAIKQSEIQFEASSDNILEEMPSDNSLRMLLDEYSKVVAKFEASGGYDYEFRIKEALAGLGLKGIDPDRDLSTLSGGEKMRVCLAQLIVERPDILMLDEPTNHLDVEAVEWLEGFLSSYGGAVFVITHDRHFIDQVANKVVELNNGQIREYRGNYSEYVRQKEEFMKSQFALVKNLEAELEHQLDVKQTMLSHRNISGYHEREKMVARVEEVLERERAKLGTNPLQMSFKLVPEIRSGAEDKILMQVNDVSKSFPSDRQGCGEVFLFEKVSFDLKADEKIFLCGPNGCGKTTLLNMLLGRESGFDGTIMISSAATCGYMGQFVPFDDEESTLYDELISRSDLTITAARSLLARFGFRGDDVFKQIKVLSGGERSRLYLCCLLQEKPDILFLDEPTNHLDIESREVLEDALRDYNGAIVCVSHDRFFVDKCATKIMGFVPVKRTAGGTFDTSNLLEYRSYKEYRRNLASISVGAGSEASVQAEGYKEPETQNKTSNRMTEGKIASQNKAQERKEQAKKRESIRELERLIEQTELRQEALQAMFGLDAGPAEYTEYAENDEKLAAYYDELDGLI